MTAGSDNLHDELRANAGATQPPNDGFALKMNPDYLDFEQPIADLEVKINELRLVGADNRLNISDEIAKLQDKNHKLTEKIFGSLTPWQISQLARHPLRPYTEDYLRYIFTDFDEMHGDRYFADDSALIGGVAYLENTPVMVMGHQKGRSTSEKVKRNFGMPKPEGYRKARRLMLLAERYKMPVLTLIDTPGAYPGVDSEARGINEAIAENLAVMSRLRTPIISTVTGEGNSGGAIAIGVCDHLNMLQYSTYFVISPEGCATILWKSSEHKALAAEAMGVTSARLEELGIVDQTIPEPLGGAHRDMKGMAARLKEQLIDQVSRLQAMDVDALVERRYRRLMSHGASRG
jgi:acetyl-CoA carboxylase carboxyl transferase subunit alpha